MKQNKDYTPIQKQIEMHVTNGLGYDSRTKFFHEDDPLEFMGLDIPYSFIKNTEAGLKRHLTDLEELNPSESKPVYVSPFKKKMIGFPVGVSLLAGVLLYNPLKDNPYETSDNDDDLPDDLKDILSGASVSGKTFSDEPEFSPTPTPTELPIRDYSCDGKLDYYNPLRGEITVDVRDPESSIIDYQEIIDQLSEYRIPDHLIGTINYNFDDIDPSIQERIQSRLYGPQICDPSLIDHLMFLEEKQAELDAEINDIESRIDEEQE